MKIILTIMLTSLSCMSLAHDAEYYPESGALIIPAVKLPDGSAFLVWMQILEGQGLAFEVRDALEVPADTGNTSANAFYETSISGSWSGWDGNTTITLTNGETWQQATYHYEYDYAYNPSVIVYQSGANWKMWVEGMEEPVTVTKLQ